MTSKDYTEWDDQEGEIIKFKLDCFYLLKLKKKLLTIMADKKSKGIRIFKNDDLKDNPLCYACLEKSAYYFTADNVGISNNKELETIMEKLINNDWGFKFYENTNLVNLYQKKNPEILCVIESEKLNSETEPVAPRKIKIM